MARLSGKRSPAYKALFANMRYTDLTDLYGGEKLNDPGPAGIGRPSR